MKKENGEKGENEENVNFSLLPTNEDTEYHNRKKAGGGSSSSSWKVGGFKRIAIITLLFLSLEVLHMQKYLVMTNNSGLMVSTKQEPLPPQCMDLDLEKNMDELLANTRQVYILMPAKAAGTSMNQFTQSCMVRHPPYGNYIQRVNNNLPTDESAKMREDMMDETLYVPPVITSHIKNDRGLIDLSQYPTRNSLIIYIHREETDRVVSSVKMVVSKACLRVASETKSEQTKSQIKSQYNMFLNETHCIVDEGPVMQTIKERREEIKMGNVNILTCNAYEALRENGPNTVFMNYRSVDKLQKLIAKHHCPDLVDKPLHSNVDADKPLQSFVRLKHEDRVVTIEDWLDVKIPTMEWVFGMRGTASCQAKTHVMEDELFDCSDQAMKITPATIRGWWEKTRR